MPTVAVLDGIKIQFVYDDHPPPHFHATHAEFNAVILIEPLEMAEGQLPKGQMRKVTTWARTRQDELLTAWRFCRAGSPPGPIS